MRVQFWPLPSREWKLLWKSDSTTTILAIHNTATIDFERTTPILFHYLHDIKVVRGGPSKIIVVLV